MPSFRELAKVFRKMTENFYNYQNFFQVHIKILASAEFFSVFNKQKLRIYLERVLSRGPCFIWIDQVLS